MNLVHSFSEPVPRSQASVPAMTIVGTAPGRVLEAHANRKLLMIQNTGTMTIFLAYGEVIPTTRAYHVALRSCAVPHDGLGGLVSVDSFTGSVQAVSDSPHGSIAITELLT